LMDKVASILNRYTKEEIQSFTSYPYLIEAVNDISNFKKVFSTFS
jgi:hypothetical protein